MRKLIFILGFALFATGFASCCKCMNCPGSAAATGNPTDVICKEDYEASTAVQTMSWAQYSDYMLQSGCSCID